MELRSICVFAGAAEGADPAYGEAAEALGRELAGRGIGLVYGAAAIGLMGRVADAALAAGGTATGVIPDFLQSREIAHPELTRLDVVGSLHERVERMVDLSDAYIALPGGIGTYAELFEVISFTLLGVAPKPCAALDVNGYFDGVVAQLGETIEQGFLGPAYRDLLLVGTEPGPLLDRLAAWEAPPARDLPRAGGSSPDPQ